jgi:hypothetical protein
MISKEKALMLDHLTWIHIRIIHQLYQYVISGNQRLDSGIYMEHLIQILKKLPDQLVQ